VFGSKKINVSLFKAKRAFALFALFSFFSLKAQLNLIPNPSFEDSTGIPNISNQLDSCKNWFNAFGSVDYFSTYSPTNLAGNCGVGIPKNDVGFQNSHSGNFYVGLSPYYKLPPSAGYPNFSLLFELIGVKLKQKLLKDHIYDFTFYYSLANSSKIVSNQLSAYFSDTMFSTNSSFNPGSQAWFDSNLNYINPQINHDTTKYIANDTSTWQTFRGCFKAKGSEEFLTIGNFRDNKFNKSIATNSTYSPSTCNANNVGDFMYLYIDDVSLYDLGYYSGKAQCKNDTIICFNSSLVIGNNIKDSSVITWQPHPSLNCTNCPNPIATPTATTKYYVTKTLCSFVTKDSITVSVFTPSINANAGTDKQLCFNERTQLGTNDSTSFTSYLWQPNQFLNCTNCATPITSPNTSITYTLQKTECSITSTSTVNVISEDCETTYEIPNIFTPNGDSVNETWGINFSQTKYIKNFSLTIYNRWGALILLSEKPNLKWDGHTTSGEVCADGVYFYTINFELNAEQKTFKGNITLIR